MRVVSIIFITGLNICKKVLVARCSNIVGQCAEFLVGELIVSCLIFLRGTFF